MDEGYVVSTTPLISVVSWFSSGSNTERFIIRFLITESTQDDQNVLSAASAIISVWGFRGHSRFCSQT